MTIELGKGNSAHPFDRGIGIPDEEQDTSKMQFIMGWHEDPERIELISRKLNLHNRPSHGNNEFTEQGLRIMEDS
ncbi:hypothetical protein ACFL21_02190 [Patescibacteria group bacterium]